MRETFNEINITPLTDIFLVLLIIMMVVAPLLDKQGISLTVPENVEQSQMDDKEPQILTIVVTQGDKYLINNEEVSPDILGTVLTQEIQKYPDGLLIQADGEASHGAVVKLSGQTEVDEEFDGNNKEVTIKNTGDTDMVVRLKVFGDENHMTMNSTGNTDWLEGTDGFWYYKKVLPAGAEASMFKVEVNGEIDPGDPIDFEITVVHESQRVTYDGDKVAVPEGWKIDSISDK